MIRAILFDLDGTLVQSWQTTPLAGIPDLLQYLREHNISIGVATNQAGPLWRLATEEEKYPTTDKVAKNILNIAKTLQLEDALWLISVSDERILKMSDQGENITIRVNLEIRKKLTSLKGTVVVSPDISWRKPKPDMLFFACREWLLPSSNVLYVGDMETDQEASKNAGMPFLWNYEIAKIPEMLKWP